MGCVVVSMVSIVSVVSLVRMVGLVRMVSVVSAVSMVRVAHFYISVSYIGVSEDTGGCWEARAALSQCREVS